MLVVEVGGLLEDKMNKKFFIFILSVVFLSVVSAAVSEYNYFKLGELDANTNLIETATSVSGVTIKGFICSDSACSGSLGDLWGGELYAPGNGLNLVYPTTLQSSYGYGFYLYKDGYVPYWVKGVTWYGTGIVPTVNRYPAKKQNCIADISIKDFSEKAGSLSFDVEVEAPIVDKSGSMYLPSEVSSHMKTLVDIDVEIKDDKGKVIWSDSDSKTVDYSGSERVSFSTNLAHGDYTLIASSSSGNEAQCLAYTVDSDDVTFNVYDNDKDDDGYSEDVDCDDLDASVWQLLSGYVDSDFDSYGVNPGVDVCSGASLPSGYSVNNNDCDDNDANVWQFLSGYRDFDGDGKSAGPAESVCSGASLPSGFEGVDDKDCDDNDISVWQLLKGYFDGDGDDYGVDPEVDVCSGASLFGSYASVSWDCDDGNYNVNPGVLEVCGDGVDNDCDGYIDEGCNSVPSVFASGNPLSGIFPLVVSFSCQGTGGDGNLEYSWDFDNGDMSDVQNPTYTYLYAGDFSAECTVSDEDGDKVSASVDVKVGMQSLEIVEVVCFDEVIEGHNQSCSVYVEDSLSAGAGGVNVDIFYSDGSDFGSCLTDGISGACGVKDLQGVVGAFEIYAVASKAGYFSDDSKSLKFGYDVLKEKYDIINLAVYSDSNFSDEDYDFFRGEGLFVKFGVEDMFGSSVSADLISNVSLVSSVAGGRVVLERVDKVGNYYYYKLIPVPVTHDFIGDSTVFAFVFDLVESAGGQEEVSLIIRNNVPVIFPSIPSQDVDEGNDISLNLSLYESDVEDSGDDLQWEVVSFESGVDVNVVGKSLFIDGKDDGKWEVVLRLFDLDGDYDEQVLSVDVEDDSDDDPDCSPNWDCSIWNVCYGGFEERICIDSEGCGSSSGKPLETRSCSDSIFGTNSEDVISFDASSVDEDGFSIWLMLIGILLLLILLILLLLFLLRGR